MSASRMTTLSCIITCGIYWETCVTKQWELLIFMRLSLWFSPICQLTTAYSTASSSSRGRYPCFFLEPGTNEQQLLGRERREVEVSHTTCLCVHSNVWYVPVCARERWKWVECYAAGFLLASCSTRKNCTSLIKHITLINNEEGHPA